MQIGRSRLGSTASPGRVGVAAAMWATDAYFRPGLTKQLSAGQIVLVEDLLISICLIPILLLNIDSLRRMTGRRWLALIAIGVGPQAIATVLFTRAIGFAFLRPTGPKFGVLHEAYLLYLLQPVFGLAFARIFLGERRRRAFWPFAATALIGVYLIVFADNPAAPVLPFLLALPVLLVIVLVDKGGAAFSGYSADQIPAFLGIVIVPGLLAMLLYYLPLSNTPASLATIAELGYPLALFLIFSLPPPVGQAAPLQPIELVGAALLVASVVALNFLKGRDVVEAPSETLVRPSGAAESA